MRKKYAYNTSYTFRPSWLKTPEEYYHQEGIEQIFNTILNSLTL